MPTFNRPERLKVDGILAYAHEKRGVKWNLRLETAAWKTGGVCDGRIIYVTDPEDRVRFSSDDIPTVLIEDVLQPACAAPGKNTVTLVCDHSAEGEAAAKHFLVRHFTDFAFIDEVEEDGSVPEWVEARYQGFSAALETKVPRFTKGDLGEFLVKLPRPSAVFCAHDFKARQVLAVAEERGLQVPGELAILGVDNDEALCETVSPALSSVPTGDYRLGYNAGRCLEELLSHRAPGGRLIKVKRTRVVSRFSTDADALKDIVVAKAIRYARSHLDEDLTLPTLARRVGYSTRTLQLKSEHSLGHPLPEEIRRMRLTAAQELLRDTDMPVSEIAARCGFTSVSHLSLRLREHLGQTPLAVRKNA